MDQATIFPLVAFVVFMAGAWLMLSLIWIYVYVLRLIALLRSRE